MPSTPPSTRLRSGAYGFRLHGLEVPGDLLVPAPQSWPALRLAVVIGPDGRRARDRFGADRAELALPTAGGSVALDRAASSVVFTVPAAIDAAAIVHPFLAAPALIAAHWLGRETFHAGAFVLDGRAWGVVGAKGDGKSSLLAWLARRGVPVLADDVVVLDDDGRALAGPRSIDLREEAAARLGVGEPLGVVGARARWRVALGPVAAEVPLAGWVAPAWAPDGAPPAARELRGAARLAALAPHRGVRLPPVADGATLLELTGLPVVELRRPRDWASADAAGEQLLAALSG
jgi:hypothetical protein